MQREASRKAENAAEKKIGEIQNLVAQPSARNIENIISIIKESSANDDQTADAAKLCKGAIEKINASLRKKDSKGTRNFEFICDFSRFHGHFPSYAQNLLSDR